MEESLMSAQIITHLLARACSGSETLEVRICECTVNIRSYPRKLIAKYFYEDKKYQLRDLQ
jgi:hypothetical protein